MPMDDYRPLQRFTTTVKLPHERSFDSKLLFDSNKELREFYESRGYKILHITRGW